MAPTNTHTTTLSTLAAGWNTLTTTENPSNNTAQSAAITKANKTSLTTNTQVTATPTINTRSTLTAPATKVDTPTAMALPTPHIHSWAKSWAATMVTEVNTPECQNTWPTKMEREDDKLDSWYWLILWRCWGNKSCYIKLFVFLINCSISITRLPVLKAIYQNYNWYFKIDILSGIFHR